MRLTLRTRVAQEATSRATSHNSPIWGVSGIVKHEVCAGIYKDLGAVSKASLANVGAGGLSRGAGNAIEGWQ